MRAVFNRQYAKQSVHHLQIRPLIPQRRFWWSRSLPSGPSRWFFPVHGQINQLHHYKWHNMGFFFFTPPPSLNPKLTWKWSGKRDINGNVGEERAGGNNGRVYTEAALCGHRASTRLLCVSLKSSCFKNKTMSPATLVGSTMCLWLGWERRFL